MIFAISVILLNTFMSSVIEKATEEKILNDMKNIYISSSEYINQLFIVNGIEFSEQAFVKNGSIIVRGLGKANNCITTIYSVNGKNPYQYVPGGFQISWDKINERHSNLINNAINNKSAVQVSKIAYKSKTFLIADFVYPLYINNNYLGIVRFSFDYTDAYISDKNLIKILVVFVLAIFASIFLFSYLLVYRLTNPLAKLNDAICEVAVGSYVGCIKTASNDEIGEISDNFNNMTNKIREQIETINEEKKRILELQKTRTEFFNNVTHELKTPLTTIYGYAQLLEGGVADKGFYNRAVDRIKLESQRLHKLVIKLIEVSKNSNISAVQFKSLNLSEIANLVVKDMNFKAERYNKKLIIMSEDTFIKGDMSGISQIFINLLDNAIKYGYVNGEVVLKVFNEEQDAVIIVENRGDAIPESETNKVFEPFFQVNRVSSREKGSSGLGLYISKTIIEQHEGTINFLSIDNIIRIVVKIPLEKKL